MSDSNEAAAAASASSADGIQTCGDIESGDVAPDVEAQPGTSDHSIADGDATKLPSSTAGSPDVETEPTMNDTNVERPWDKSNLKVVVHGVMAFHDPKAFSKMIDQWLKAMTCSSDESGKITIAYDKVKKPPKATWAVVTMKDESMVKPLIDYINDNDLRNQKGNKFFAKCGSDGVESTSGGKHPRNDNSNDPQTSKRQRNAPTTEKLQQARRPITVDELKDRVTPMWKLTPEKQLNTKMSEMVKKCAQKITKDLKAKFR